MPFWVYVYKNISRHAEKHSGLCTTTPHRQTYSWAEASSVVSSRYHNLPATSLCRMRPKLQTHSRLAKRFVREEKICDKNSSYYSQFVSCQNNCRSTPKCQCIDANLCSISKTNTMGENISSAGYLGCFCIVSILRLYFLFAVPKLTQQTAFIENNVLPVKYVHLPTLAQTNYSTEIKGIKTLIVLCSTNRK